MKKKLLSNYLVIFAFIELQQEKRKLEFFLSVKSKTIHLYSTWSGLLKTQNIQIDSAEKIEIKLKKPHAYYYTKLLDGIQIEN